MQPRIKKTYICSDVNEYTLDKSLICSYIPEAGDVAVFEVLSIGKHTQMQSDSGRSVKIMPGDLIMAAFGTRYATAQFEGYLPVTCLREFDILGAGGTIGIVKSMHARFSQDGPTRLKIIGYATAAGKVINTKKMKALYVKQFADMNAVQSRVILSIGSSMDSGKTTSAAHLIHGLKKKNKTVAFIKLTGTVYTKDKDLAYDLGADLSVDFSDFGFPSTFMCNEEELLNLYASLIHKVQEIRPDYIVMEIADGIFQRETKMLLKQQAFIKTISGTIFSAGDSLGIMNGLTILESWGITPFALSGIFTTSPLLIGEVKEQTRIPVLTLPDLQNISPGLITKNRNLLTAA